MNTLTLVLLVSSLLSPIVAAAQQKSHLRVDGAVQGQGHRALTSSTATGRVTKLRLINADTNQPIAAYDPLPTKALVNVATLATANLNIEAVTEGPVGSVQWVFNGERRIEDFALWAYCGNNGTDFYACQRLKIGLNTTISATPYAAKGASGAAGAGVSIELAIVKTNKPPVVMSFTLMNADTDTELGPLRNDTVIDLSKTPRVNVRANVEPSVLIASVQFALNGKNARIENGAPYAFASNNGNDYFAWTPPAGRHVLKGSAFGARDAQGTLWSTETVSFLVKSSAVPSAPTKAPVLPPKAEAPVPAAPTPNAAAPTKAPRAPTKSPRAPTKAPRAPTSAPRRAPTRKPSRRPVPAPTQFPTPALPTPMPLFVHTPTTAQDATPPKLVNLVLHHPIVDVTSAQATSTVEVTVQDDNSGIQRCLVAAQGPRHFDSDEIFPTRNTGNRTVTFNLTLTFPAKIKQGNYSLSVLLNDFRGNPNDYYYNRLEELGLPTAIKVINTNEDLSPPKVLQFKATSPTIVDVSDSSATATFLVELEDAGFGVRTATIFASDGKRKWIESYRYVNEPVIGKHTFYYSVTFPQFTKPSNFTLRLDVSDWDYNQQTYNSTELASLGFPSTVQLVNRKPDVTPPTLVSFTGGPSIVNSSAPGAYAAFSVSADDSESGLYYGLAVTATYDTNKTIVKGPRYMPGPIRGRFDFSAFFPITADSWRGLYKLTVSLGDVEDNVLVLSSEDLIARGLPGNFTIV